MDAGLRSCRDGDVDSLSRILSEGFRPMPSWLVECVRNNHKEALQLLLGHGMDPSATTQGSTVGPTPLHVAAAVGSVDCAKCLLEWKADINAKDFENRTPLDVAAEIGNESVSALLIRWVHHNEDEPSQAYTPTNHPHLIFPPLQQVQSGSSGWDDLEVEHTSDSDSFDEDNREQIVTPTAALIEGIRVLETSPPPSSETTGTQTDPVTAETEVGTGVLDEIKAALNEKGQQLAEKEWELKEIENALNAKSEQLALREWKLGQTVKDMKVKPENPAVARNFSEPSAVPKNDSKRISWFRKKSDPIGETVSWKQIEDKAPPKQSYLRKKAKKKVTPLSNLDIADFEVHALIGRGGSGATVYTVFIAGFMCAMKCVTGDDAVAEDMEALKGEIEILESLPPHDHLVRYLGHAEGFSGLPPNTVAMFMQYYPNTLDKVIKDRSSAPGGVIPLPSRTIKNYALQIALGLSFLHQNNIIHRDLKSGNVFISFSQTGEIKQLIIGDFDSSKKIAAKVQANTTVGSSGYTAPEVLNPSRRKSGYTTKADIFSFGMLIVEMITLKRPFMINLEEKGCPPIDQMILQGIPPLVDITPYDEDDAVLECLLNLYQRCTDSEPEQRPSANDIVGELNSI